MFLVKIYTVNLFYLPSTKDALKGKMFLKKKKTLKNNVNNINCVDFLKDADIY